MKDLLIAGAMTLVFTLLGHALWEGLVRDKVLKNKGGDSFEGV